MPSRFYGRASFFSKEFERGKRKKVSLYLIFEPIKRKENLLFENLIFL